MSATVIRCALRRLHLDPSTAKHCHDPEETTRSPSTLSSLTSTFSSAPAARIDSPDLSVSTGYGIAPFSASSSRNNFEIPGMASPSTDVVPETPYDILPAIGQAGPSNWHRRISQQSGLWDNDPWTENDEPQEATRQSNLIKAQEVAHLRRARAQLVEELKNSTAQVNRLRTRGRVHEANALATSVLLSQADADRQAVLEASEQKRMVSDRLWMVLGSMLLALVVYVMWCWHRGPEMEYIRRRRAEVLME